MDQIPITDVTTSPTVPTIPPGPPIRGGGFNPFGMLIALAFVGVVITLIIAYRYYRGSTRVEGKDIRPELSDLDSSSAELGMFLLVQGGMAIVITVGVLLSLQWLLTQPVLTLTSSVSFIGLSMAVRSWLKDRVRERYKNRFNLEGYMRDKKGNKRRYCWSKVDILTPYILDEDMIRQIEEETQELTNDEGQPLRWTRERLEEVEATPIDINGEYIVIVLSKGPLELEWVEWWDIDMFGDYSIPSAGPELRHIATIHRVAEDPMDPFYKRNEYIPVFVSIWDDRSSKQATEMLPAIDVEKDDVHIGLIKAVGVERKVTAGEANTDRAALLDALNSQRDFDDIVEATADLKAVKYVADKERIGRLDRMTANLDPSLLVKVVIFAVGLIVGFVWGQNVILSRMIG